ncbi:LOW QUALITY PROTEIN: hypothetical protein PHMEG_0009709 [Phytophthora megakarya]|uniref:Uncharacterized protein n=1 Tax=Phytophthora megakarya TaxID=4795 RepID=A0A225WFJ3_9STRA|nr:LOW QUALITY PROTEIN: hypothetical protein PHMEG_0009709 [Phytophthora megakarya]
MKSRDEKTTYPDMKFKSKFSPSNTIEIRKRSMSVVEKHRQDFVRFHTKFFGMEAGDGIALHERLPALERSVRLQRLREGEYYLIVRRLRAFDPSTSERVCALDPGVRKFATVYDPDGRTFSVKDARSVLKKTFEAVDEMKSMLARMTNAQTLNPHDRTETSRSSEHRLCYRLRRRIRFTSRKATRAVNDMHQKLSSWLAAKYKQVLLPSFHTSEMVRRHFLEAAADATTENAAVQKRKIRNIFHKNIGACRSGKPYSVLEKDILLTMRMLGYREPAVKILIEMLLSEANRLAFLFGPNDEVKTNSSILDEKTEYVDMCTAKYQRNPLRSQFRECEDNLIFGRRQWSRVAISADQMTYYDPAPMR